MKTTVRLLVAGLSTSLFAFALAAQEQSTDTPPPTPPSNQEAQPNAPEDAETDVDIGPIQEAPAPQLPPAGGTGDGTQAPVPFAPPAIVGTVVYFNQEDRVILLRTEDSVRMLQLDENAKITEDGEDSHPDAIRPNVHILARVLFREMDVIGTHIEVLQELPEGIAPASAVPPSTSTPS
ncbi:hypothetical protein ASA1KI_01550 [Opitutales bacterium ASA1]|uniref:hypothetical protein n=1 Tax=Congregicoccus parvus TaxID=3081749 RepID=UPI002B2C433C|nr:hypothetical protein ASA1KI_01550 [Opitutales bacterium ASA1]